MARRYEIEELLWLRDSPLVIRPDKLPPLEEWMGPIPDPTARKQNHRDQNQADSTTTPRRPSLFEPRHISRNSNSEDIVLGPPRTAFASASRIHGKGSYDTTERPSRYNDIEEKKADRFNFRDRFIKDREGSDRDLEKREGKSGDANGRRNDREDWNLGRQRRTFGPNETDQRAKRNGDTSRWEARDKLDESGFNRSLKDKDGRFDKEGRFVKRDAPPRGRHEQSWFRDETMGGESAELEEEKPFMRSREWRRERQLPDRDWNRGTRMEQDPEWMDSTDHDEPKQTHTQEDFQRWKERMKAGSTAPVQADERTEAIPGQASPDDQKVETNHLDGELFASSKSHLPIDAGFDRFFGLLGESKQTVSDAATTLAPPESIKRDPGSAKASKSSRFAGLFSPPPDTSVKGTEPVQALVQPGRPASTDADQEGFQRILQMLGGSKSRNTTPQVDITRQPRPPSYISNEQDHRPTPPPPGLPSPSRNPMNRQDEMMAAAQENVTSRAMHHPPPGMETLLPSREPQAQFQDREHLLRLMQQVNMSSPTLPQHGNAPPPPTQLSQGGHTPGILNVPDLLSRPPGMQKVPRNQAFLDDPAIANMQRPDSELKGQQVRKPPVNGPLQMRYFDEMPPFPGTSQAAGHTTPGVAGAGRDPQVPHSHMNIQRPPGFAHVPASHPGWPGQIPPQQGGLGGALGPPPGIPNPNKGMNPGFLTNPLSVPGLNMPPPSENPAFLRGNVSGGNFSLPPGMLPPPGYMNMNGPPPPSGNFMPGHLNPEVMLNASGGQNGGFSGAAGGSSGHPPSSRHLLEMLAHANGGDGRGAMLGGGPGQFR
ncbi:hypothetical protein UA08_03559 [Talaromyces atroroseus]|uniref:Uncharacterized protein n=1 Tax=Talaromyces atroroseus TaxID=1441469 RepID=A0A225AHK5_TALAT|nr:hypothetical protein UA08_03559 [Talaromyces atroroseus]OKL60911.1 hypothetical protein UA08_03559 [Talaromyces atroroseus]